MTKHERPPIVTDEHLEYLDDLRKSGATNMYGAGVYLRDEWPSLSQKESHEILGYWMKTFGDEER